MERNNAGIYAIFMPSLREAARSHGYALGLHGSMIRDCDLIAAPWTDDASEPEALIEALRQAVDGTLDAPHPRGPQPSEKPHGRRAWSIYMGNHLYLDVSVMPRAGRPAFGSRITDADAESCRRVASAIGEIKPEAVHQPHGREPLLRDAAKGGA